jgi:hypothetical protein
MGYYLFVERLLIGGGTGTVFMTKVKMMPSQFESSLLYRPLWGSVWLKSAIYVFNSIGSGLIIQLILSQLIMMAAHHSDISDALSLVRTLPWVVAILKTQLCNCVENWASRWRSNIPGGDTESIFDIRVDGDSLEAWRVILEVRLVRGLHLEFLENGVSQTEM